MRTLCYTTVWRSEGSKISPLLFSRYVVSDSFAMPWTVAWQAPLCMGFPRQKYWSVLPFPSRRDLPDPGIKPASPALAGWIFTTELPGKPKIQPYLQASKSACHRFTDDSKGHRTPRSEIEEFITRGTWDNGNLRLPSVPLASHQFPFSPKLCEDDTVVGPSFVKSWACVNQSVHLVDTFEEDAIHGEKFKRVSSLKINPLHNMLTEPNHIQTD